MRVVGLSGHLSRECKPSGHPPRVARCMCEQMCVSICVWGEQFQIFLKLALDSLFYSERGNVVDGKKVEILPVGHH